MDLKTYNVMHVLFTLCFLYMTADSIDSAATASKMSSYGKPSYFDTMARMDTSWKKAPKKVTVPLKVIDNVPFALRNGPTGSPYLEGLTYFGWCFGVTYVTFRFLWYVLSLLAKKVFGHEEVKIEGKIGLFVMIFVAILVTVFAVIGMAFTVNTMEIQRSTAFKGKKAVFNIATTTWNKLDIIAFDLGEMDKFLYYHPDASDGGMTKEKAKKLQNLINKNKEILDTDQYDEYIKLLNKTFPPKYQAYAAIGLFALLAVFVILTIFRNQFHMCGACNTFMEPLWYLFIVFLVIVSTFTIFANDLCKDDGAPGIVAEQAFANMKFDAKTSKLMGDFYKYYFVCNGKTDHPLGNIMNLNDKSSRTRNLGSSKPLRKQLFFMDEKRRNLSEDNPLAGTILEGLLKPDEAAAINQMLKSQPDMKKNLDDSESFFKKNPKFKAKLKEAKNLDELMDLTDKIGGNPAGNNGLMVSFDSSKLEFVSKQMHLMTLMAKLRVDTDCKKFIDDIKEAKKEACDGLNGSVIIIAMIMVLLTMDFVVIILQNLYSWCKNKKIEESEVEAYSEWVV